MLQFVTWHKRNTITEHACFIDAHAIVTFPLNLRTTKLSFITYIVNKRQSFWLCLFNESRVWHLMKGHFSRRRNRHSVVNRFDKSVKCATQNSQRHIFQFIRLTGGLFIWAMWDAQLPPTLRKESEILWNTEYLKIVCQYGKSNKFWEDLIAYFHSPSDFTTGGLPPISSSWRQDPWDSRRVILFSNRTLAIIALM
jgi:hypothetical protein